MLRAVEAIERAPEHAATTTYNAAMAGCRLLGRTEQALALWDQMRATNVKPNPESYQHALVCAMRLQRHKQALDVWQMLDEDPSTTPTVVEYTAAISACERAGDPSRGLSLFDAMQANGITPDSNTIHVAIVAAGRAGEPQRAADLLARIELLGARPPTELYNAAAQACEARGEWRLASQLLSRMHRRGVARDAKTYSAVVSACRAGGDASRSKLLSAVDQLLQEPEGRVVGWTSDIALCDAAFDACASSGHWRSATALLELLRPSAAAVRRPSSEGGAAGPSDGVDRMRLWYSQSLQACASRGEWRTAVKLLSQVNRHLVDAAIAEGRAEEVYSARCTECYAHTIAACSNAGQWAQLLQLYNEMESSGLPPRRASHNAAILALGKTGKTDQALALFHRIDMEASEGAAALASSDASVPIHLRAVEPEGPLTGRASADVCSSLSSGGGTGPVGEHAPLGTASFNAVLIACVEGREYARALSLIDEMKSRDVRMNALTYTAAIAAAQKAGDTPLAVKWLNEMSSKRELQQNELTITAAVSAHSRTWRASEALTLLSKYGKGAAPPAASSSSSSSAEAAAQESEEVLTSVEADDPAVRVTPRTAAYNEAMAACVREEEWDEAVRLYEQMGSVVPRDRTTLALAARAVAAQGEWKRGCRILAESRAAGWPPPHAAVAAVMRACGERGEWLAALRVLWHEHDEHSSAATGAAASKSSKADDESATTTVTTPLGLRRVSVDAVADAAASDDYTHRHGSEGSGELRALAMHACNLAGQWEQSLRLFDAVRKSGAVPGASEWRAALESFAQAGLWRQARVALTAMERGGMGVSVPELSQAATACARAIRNKRVSWMGQVTPAKPVTSDAEWEALQRVLTIAASEGSESLAAVRQSAVDACGDDIESVETVKRMAVAIVDDHPSAAWSPPTAEEGEPSNTASDAAAFIASPPRRRSTAQEASDDLVTLAKMRDWPAVKEKLVEESATGNLLPQQLTTAILMASSKSEFELTMDLHAEALIAIGRSRLRRLRKWRMSMPRRSYDKKRYCFHSKFEITEEEAAHLAALEACRRLGQWERAAQIAGFVAFDEPFNRELAEAKAEEHTAAMAAAEESGGGAAAVPKTETLLAHDVRTRATAEAMSACMQERDADGNPVHDALEAALQLFERAEKAGLANTAVYGCAMQALLLAGRRSAAFELYGIGVGKGLEFGTVEKNIAIGVGARCGELDDALRILNGMKSAAETTPSARPDVGSYDAILSRMASAGRHDELLDLFSDMHDLGLQPLESHYRLAIGACASLGNGGKAAELLLKMQVYEMDYTRATADAIFACNKANMPDVALDIFEAAGKGSIAPSTTSSSSSTGGKHEQAARHATFVFNGALDALRRTGDASKAVEMLLAMPIDHGVTPDTCSYTTTLAACRASDRFDLSIHVLSAIARRASTEEGGVGWVNTDDLHAELISCFEKEGQPKRALRLYAQLLRAKAPVSRHLYNALLSSVCNLTEEIGDDNASTGRPPPLAWHVMGVGMQHGVWGQPVEVTPHGEAFIDLKPFNTPASLKVAVHYYLHYLSETFKADGLNGVPPLSDVILITNSPDSRSTYRARLVGESLSEFELPYYEAYENGSAAIRLPSQALTESRIEFGPTHMGSAEMMAPHIEFGKESSSSLSSSSQGQSRGMSPEELCEMVEEAIGPESDAIDAVIEQLAHTLAPLPMWLKQKEHKERRQAMKNHLKRRKREKSYLQEEGGGRGGSSSSRASSASPSPQGSKSVEGQHWTTPRPQDRRPRDGKGRAEALRPFALYSEQRRRNKATVDSDT